MSERRLLVAHYITCIHHRKTPTCTAMHKQELPKAEQAQNAPLNGRTRQDDYNQPTQLSQPTSPSAPASLQIVVIIARLLLIVIVLPAVVVVKAVGLSLVTRLAIGRVPFLPVAVLSAGRRRGVRD